MKRIPLFLAGLFLAITLARVAGFTSREMSAGILGWVYAIGLGVAVYTAAYWTRNATTRRPAAIALAFFILADCLFNFSEVWLTSSLRSPLVVAGAIVYGLFPTAAVALLGWLQTSIARMPPTKNEVRIKSAWSTWLANRLQVEAKPAPEPVAQSEPEPELPRYVCVRCGYAAKSQNGLNAHAKTHINHNGYHKVLEESNANTSVSVLQK